MSEFEWLILWIAAPLFLLIAALKLIIVELISLVEQLKKLKATLKCEYSVESRKLKVREQRNVRKKCF